MKQSHNNSSKHSITHLILQKILTVFVLILLPLNVAYPETSNPNSTLKTTQHASPSNIRIIPMQNAAQPFELAAKLQWNPQTQTWDKVLVVYNNHKTPPADHPIWTYLSGLTIPQRKARITGENLHYKAFHSYNYCTANSALNKQKKVVIDFNSNTLGRYTQKDFAKDWNCPAWAMGKNLVSIVEGEKARNKKGLQLRFPSNEAGCGEKNCMNWKPSLGGKFEQINYSYWIKFPDDFDFVLGGKLPGVGSDKSNSGGNKPTGYDGWSVRVMWNRHGQLGQYIYHMDQPSVFGEFVPWNMPVVQKGKWHQIKTHIQLNTPKQANGIVRTHVDGKLVLDKTDVRFRMKQGLEIERFLFSAFFGGNGQQWAPKKEQFLYLDDIVLSR